MLKLRPVITFLRNIRKYHRSIGISLSALFIISALTGVLLAYKKHINFIQPKTQSSIHAEAQGMDYMSIDSLIQIAKQSASLKTDQAQIDRLDIRPEKGIAKVLFKDLNWEIQLDLRTGEVLSQQARYSDLIERIHDGSIISDGFKVGSMSILGLGLIILTISGISLWFGPKYIRRQKNITNTLE